MNKKLLIPLVALIVVLVGVLVVVIVQSNNPDSPDSQCAHQWIEADCLYPKTCRICSQTQGAALGHQFVDATCTEPKTCQNCNLTEGKSLGHSWQDATCEHPKTCSICATTEGTVLSEHNYQNGKCIYCNQSDPKEAEFVVANNAYDYLVESHEMCVEVMDSIYGAWYFAIYEADDYYSLNSCLRAFCSESNLSQGDTLEAIDMVLESSGISNIDDDYRCAALQVPSYAVAIVVQVYTNNGVYAQINSNLSNAQTSLKTVTNNYSDYTGYPTLKSYYSEVYSYYEFCESPSGSFSQLKSTINTYETNLKNYKNDLSFIFE